MTSVIFKIDLSLIIFRCSCDEDRSVEILRAKVNIELNFILNYIKFYRYYILFLYPRWNHDVKKRECEDRTWVRMWLRYFILFARDEGFVRVFHGRSFITFSALRIYSFLRKWRRSISTRESKRIQPLERMHSCILHIVATFEHYHRRHWCVYYPAWETFRVSSLLQCL